MKNCILTRISFPIILCFTLIFNSLAQESSLNNPLRIRYNNPGLTVDLGAGLWAWPLPMDYDHDGDMDLLVNCTDKPFNGIWLFENKTGEKVPIFEPPIRISDPEKNIQVSFTDGKPIITTPEISYPNFSESLFQDPDTLIKSNSHQHLVKKERFNLWRLVDYDGDGDLDIIVALDDWTDYGWDNAFNKEGVWQNGSIHGSVYLIEKVGPDEYAEPKSILAGGKELENYGVTGANFADFDSDGDLDIILGEFIDRLTWVENTGTRERPEYATGKFLKQKGKTLHMDLEMIIPCAIDWDGDNHVDLIVGEEDGRVSLLRNTRKTDQDGPVFEKPEYLQQKAEFLKFGALVTPWSIDWDNDGDEDLICGNTAGYIGFIENLDGGETPKWAKPRYLKAGGETIRILAGDNGSIQGPAEKKWGYTTLSVADWNGDDLPDILINSIWGKIAWYENTGTKSKPELVASKPIEVEWTGVNPKPKWNWWDPEEKNLVTQWRTTPVAYDWNEDGLMDLILLDQEGYLAFWERYEENGTLKLKPGQRIFTAESNTEFTNSFAVDKNGLLRLNTKEAGGSGRRKFCIVDWDQDGRLDFLVNSENVNFLRNKGIKNGLVVLEDMGPLSTKKMAGHSTSPTIVDWNKNGVPDLLFGAEDGHFYYIQNKKNNWRKNQYITGKIGDTNHIK